MPARDHFTRLYAHTDPPSHVVLLGGATVGEAEQCARGHCVTKAVAILVSLSLAVLGIGRSHAGRHNDPSGIRERTGKNTVRPPVSLLVRGSSLSVCVDGHQTARHPGPSFLQTDTPNPLCGSRRL